MKRLSRIILFVIPLILCLTISASSQMRGMMRITDPRTNEVQMVKGYENSYAVCIGIDKYGYWPQLN